MATARSSTGHILFPCPCCGFRTLTASGSSQQRCPICYWFDYTLSSTYDRWKLWNAQVSFERSGSSSPAWAELTRQANSTDSRDPKYTIDDAPERLRIALFVDAEQKVHDAFAGVPPTGRITLGEAYRGEVTAHDHPWGWHDHDEHWWEIPDEVLDASARLAGIFSHGNYASCLYYIAAYLTKDLRTGDDTGLSAVTRLRWHGLNGETAPPESLLTPTQRAAVAAFLRYMTAFSSPAYTRDIAESAISRFEDTVA